VAFEFRVRVPVAVKAEAVEPRFRSFLEIRAMAAMTPDAGIEARLIDVIVVTEQTVDGRVLVMRKVEGQGRRTMKHGLAETLVHSA
jgi:hypothetical protein